MSNQATSAEKTADDNADTLTERAAALLRRAVLTGELAPGAKLRIRDLIKAYGIGATPLREALSRLVTVGFVQATGQRGFNVVPISKADLLDITRTRILIEREALRLSIEAGDDAWEAGIVAALYRLKKAASVRADGISEGQVDFDTIHKDFHTSLLAACGSPRLLELQAMLFDQTFRYRQVVSRRHGGYKVTADEHQRLADAAIARNFSEAAAILEAHIGITMKIAYEPAVSASGSSGKAAKGSKGKRQRA